MAKSNNLSSLLNSVSRGGSRSQGGSTSNLAAQAGGSGSSGNKLSAGRNSDVRTQSFNTVTEARGIVFGKAAGSGTSSNQQSGGEFTNLLKQAAQGGIMSALGGSFGLGSISGLGSIISGITSLFGGGKKTLPALVQFQLPDSQNQTLSIGAIGTAMSQGNASSSSHGSGTYNNVAEVAPGATNTQWIQDQNGQIAQAVKTALLHSSSLSDVISEI